MNSLESVSTSRDFFGNDTASILPLVVGFINSELLASNISQGASVKQLEKMSADTESERQFSANRIESVALKATNGIDRLRSKNSQLLGILGSEIDEFKSVRDSILNVSNSTSQVIAQMIPAMSGNPFNYTGFNISNATENLLANATAVINGIGVDIDNLILRASSLTG
jgi:hypothetical protein